jgi:hypothetical protein
MNSAGPPAHSRAYLRDELLRWLAIIGSGSASAGILGLWRAAFVQCTSLSTPGAYPSCPFGMEGVSLYLVILTLAAVGLAGSLVAGTLPRLASISAAVLTVGAFLFPYELAFPSLAPTSSGWNPEFAAAAMVEIGALSGFLEPIRLQESGRLPTREPISMITVGGALIAFTGGTAYWLPEMLSASIVCVGGPAGAPCLWTTPLIPEPFSLGLVALGIAIAASVLFRRLAAAGLICAVGVFAAAVLAFAVGEFLVAVGLGLGSLFAVAGLAPRVFPLGAVVRPPAPAPRRPEPRQGA